MKKSKLILALAISAMVINTAHASEEIENTNDEKIMEETQLTVAKITERYVVKKIEAQGVLLAKKSNPNDLYNVPKKEFKGIELKEGMEVDIVSDDVILETDPAQFAKIYEIREVKKEENEDNKEEKLVRDFVVKEIYEEGVDLYEVGNESNLFNVPKSEFKDMKIEKGKVFTITSDTIATKSVPAQFGKIFSIVEKEMPAKTMVKSYVVEEVAKDFVTVSEEGMKESKYNIAKKDFGKNNPKVGETYKIETSEEILLSDPAQFAKIYKVELVKEAPKENKKQGEKDKKEQMLSDIYVVEKIDKEGVTVARKSNKEDKFLVPKKDFGKLEIKEGKEYKIYTDDIVLTSYPAQFGKIFKIEEVKANENKNPAEKDKKPENKKPAENNKKPEKDNKEAMISDIFVVEKIYEEGVTVARKSNKEDKYLVPKKDFGKLEIKEGKEYKIYTDDIVLTSYPAQFGKIYKIEEVMNMPKQKDNNKDNKKGSKNPKTGLIGTSMTLMALGAASLGYKKIKK